MAKSLSPQFKALVISSNLAHLASWLLKWCGCDHNWMGDRFRFLALCLKNFMWKEPRISKFIDLIKFLESKYEMVYRLLSEIKQLLPAAKPFQKYSKNTFYYGHNFFR